MTEILIKKLNNNSSCLEKVDLPTNTTDDSIIDDDYIISILEKSYVKFNKHIETFMTLNTYKTTSITLRDLKSGIVIITKTFKIQSQYDTPYNDISNQCSWVSKEFVMNKNKIVDAIQNKDNNLLLEIYKNCLQNGTDNRKKFYSKVEGENIDEINLDIDLQTTVYGDMNVLYAMLGQDIINKIYKPNLKLFDYNHFIKQIKNMQNNNMMILNRDGQSFCFLKIDDSYIILDSHIRNIYFYKFDTLINYILENNLDGFFYIIYGIIE
jgi:hypothetical protein